MKGSSFTYLIKEGARNIWVNRMMSLASIGHFGFLYAADWQRDSSVH